MDPAEAAGMSGCGRTGMCVKSVNQFPDPSGHGGQQSVSHFPNVPARSIVAAFTKSREGIGTRSWRIFLVVSVLDFFQADFLLNLHFKSVLV